MLSVSTNMMSINAHHNLKMVSRNGDRASERLSSGYRINRAADGAAGLVVSQKMRNQVEGLDKAGRNMEDGVSLFTVGDGALSEVGEMTARIRELAVQASNDTLLDEDRQKLDVEVQQLLKSIDFIGRETDFNGYKIFRAMAPEEITTPGSGGPAKSLMKSRYALDDPGIISVLSGCSTTVADTQNFAKSDLNDSSFLGQVSFDLGAMLAYVDSDFDDFVQNQLLANSPMLEADKDYFLNTMVDALQEGFDQYDGTAPIPTVDGYFDADGKMVLTFTDVTLSVGCTPASSNSFGHGFLHMMFDSTSVAEDVPTTSEEVYVKRLQIQDGANMGQNTLFSWSPLSTELMGIDSVSIATREEAQAALSKCDRGIEYATNLRARFGSFTNRMNASARSVQVTSDNLSAAESRIRDTDMAKEMMNFTKANILSQVGMSMLSQANQVPNNILALVR